LLIAFDIISFCRAALNAGGLVRRKLSVYPSIKRVDCDKTGKRSVHIFIPYEKPFSLVF